MKPSPGKILIAIISALIFESSANLWAETNGKMEVSSSSENACKSSTTLASSTSSLMSQATKINHCLDNKNSLLPNADAILQVDEKVLESCYEPPKSDEPPLKGGYGETRFRKRKNTENCLNFPEDVAVKTGAIYQDECAILELLKRGRCHKNYDSYVAVMNHYGKPFYYTERIAIKKLSDSIHLSINETRQKIIQKFKEEYVTLVRAGISHRDIQPKNLLITEVPVHHDFMMTLVDFGRSFKNSENKWEEQKLEVINVCEILGELKPGQKYQTLKIRTDCFDTVTEFRKKHHLRDSSVLNEKQRAALIELVRSF